MQRIPPAGSAGIASCSIHAVGATAATSTWGAGLAACQFMTCPRVMLKAVVPAESGAAVLASPCVTCHCWALPRGCTSSKLHSMVPSLPCTWPSTAHSWQGWREWQRGTGGHRGKQGFTGTATASHVPEPGRSDARGPGCLSNCTQHPPGNSGHGVSPFRTGSHLALSHHP